MKNFRLRLAAGLAAATLAAGAMPVFAANAAETKYSNIVVLGDSISSGYALGKEDWGYYNYLADMYGATLTNYAVPGFTTADLLAWIDDSKVSAAVSKADLICLSIGGNDMLQPTKEYFAAKLDEGESFLEYFSRIAQESEEKLQQVAGELTAALREPIKQAQTNCPLIVEKLQALNPDAQIVVQTVYNPFEISDYELSQRDAQSAKNYNTFSSYVAGQITRINTSIRKLEGVAISDTYNDMKGSAWMYLNRASNDIHPNALGHAFIAASILKKLGATPKKYERVGELLEKMSLLDFQELPDDDRALLNSYAVMPELSFGDLDYNGKIELADILMAQEHYALTMMGVPTTISYRSFCAGIVMEGHEDIELTDIIAILEYYNLNELLGVGASWYDITENPNAPDAPKK